MQVWFVFLSQHLDLLQRFLHVCRPTNTVSLLYGKPLEERGCVFGLIMIDF